MWKEACLTAYPQLKSIEPKALEALLTHGKVVRLEPGTRVFGEGDPCQNFILLLSGAVRVQKLSESGREIVLYRVESGQTCIITTSCLMSCENYPAQAVVEKEVSAVLIPMKDFEEALGLSEKFRRFVLSTYGDRVTGLISLVEEVAFGKMDQRLAACLLERAQEGVVSLTHQELAVELGTMREVVSRLLKEFERQGFVALSRGKVELKNPTKLKALTEVKS